ncbi:MULTISPECIES: GPW/gp25 family protein [Serratia]|uniref:GPW/gp25 family protein n=1 Tax=Serratia TaxID=613 RepID=UPI00079FD69F|nr:MULTISPECIES: GPW/gp25 family protein [Serratia]KYQ96999.1 hypothetical protein AWY96_00180 [Serratia plymuthica]CAI1560859.1 type VI secretion system lysozyme-like protein [Serratia entomophila]
MNNHDKELTRLYGAGWEFPLRFNPPSRDSPLDSTVAMSAGADNVAQSLKVLFQTQPGERIMRPEYGCDMQSAVFANLSEGTLAALRNRIAESVARHEPRAEDVAIVVEEDMSHQGMLCITVRYRLTGREQQMTGQLNRLDGMGGGAGAWVIS